MRSKGIDHTAMHQAADSHDGWRLPSEHLPRALGAVRPPRRTPAQPAVARSIEGPKILVQRKKFQKPTEKKGQTFPETKRHDRGASFEYLAFARIFRAVPARIYPRKGGFRQRHEMRCNRGAQLARSRPHRAACVAAGREKYEKAGGDRSFALSHGADVVRRAYTLSAVRSLIDCEGDVISKISSPIGLAAACRVFGGLYIRCATTTPCCTGHHDRGTATSRWHASFGV